MTGSLARACHVSLTTAGNAPSYALPGSQVSWGTALEQVSRTAWHQQTVLCAATNGVCWSASSRSHPGPAARARHRHTELTGRLASQTAHGSGRRSAPRVAFPVRQDLPTLCGACRPCEPFLNKYLQCREKPPEPSASRIEAGRRALPRSETAKSGGRRLQPLRAASPRLGERVPASPLLTVCSEVPRSD